MTFIRAIAASSAIFLGVAACVADRSELSFDDLAKDLEYILELIADHELSDEEITRATREYYALFDKHCVELCVENTQANRDAVEPMKSKPGQPLDLLARQYYSRTLYFSPTQAGSFIQQLTNEVDPIRIADAKSKRIMTEGDIVGVLNIKEFLRDGGKPTSRTFSAAEIDAEVASYRQRFVDGVFKLPFRAGVAAELWAGLQQNWRSFDANQKQQLRDFLENKDGFATMDRTTFQALWGMDEAAAADWKQTFTSEQQYARLEYISYITMMGAAARISNESEAYWRW